MGHSAERDSLDVGSVGEEPRGRYCGHVPLHDVAVDVYCAPTRPVALLGGPEGLAVGTPAALVVALGLAEPVLFDGVTTASLLPRRRTIGEAGSGPGCVPVAPACFGPRGCGVALRGALSYGAAPLGWTGRCSASLARTASM